MDLRTIIGQVTPPPNPYGDITTAGGGLALLLTNVVRLAFVGGGIFAFLNFLIAGFQYMSAGGDPKNMQKAWDRIWQSLLGLILMVGSFGLAVLFGFLIFGDPMFILRPQIYGPAGPNP